MRKYVVVFMASVCLAGMGTLTMAFESTNLGGNPIQHRDDAQETMNEMTVKGQEKVEQAKEEARKPSRHEEIHTRNKENINNKIDAMKEEVMGK